MLTCWKINFHLNIIDAQDHMLIAFAHAFETG